MDFLRESKHIGNTLESLYRPHVPVHFHKVYLISRPLSNASAVSPASSGSPRPPANSCGRGGPSREAYSSISSDRQTLRSLSDLRLTARFLPFFPLPRCQNAHVAQLRSAFAALYRKKIIRNRLEVSKSDRLLVMRMPISKRG